MLCSLYFINETNVEATSIYFEEIFFLRCLFFKFKSCISLSNKKEVYAQNYHELNIQRPARQYFMLELIHLSQYFEVHEPVFVYLVKFSG